MNDIIKAAKSHPVRYGNMKREFTEAVAWHVKAKNPPQREEVFIELTWYEKEKRRDPDNIAAAKKFIFDGLVMANVIPKDTRKHILGWKETVIYKQDNKQGVEVRLI